MSFPPESSQQSSLLKSPFWVAQNLRWLPITCRSVHSFLTMTSETFPDLASAYSSWPSLLAPWTPELPGASSRRHAASRVCTAPYTGLLISFLPDALLQHSQTSNRCFAMSVAQHLPRYYHAEWDHFLLIVKICVCISVSLCRLYNRRFIRTMITYLCLYPHQVAESFEHCRT